MTHRRGCARGPQHAFEFANARYLEAIGNRNLVGKRFREALPELEGQPFAGLLDNVYRTGEPIFANEVPAQLVRGRVALEELSGQLRASEARFRGMAEAIPQQLWTARGDGTVAFVNSKVTEYAGKSIDRVLAEGWTKQIQPDELAHANVFQQQLLAVVGHDLRNPLNAIAVTAQLRQKKADPALEPLVARISRSVVRMKRIIGDIVDFTRARIGSGLPIARQPCSARELCREVIDELSLVHPDRLIRLEADDPCEGEWDALRLQQAVSNLVANGLQYSRLGTEVLVRVESLPEVLAISVQNEGPAIPASALARVFEPFKRREEQHPQGSNLGNLGLGLYIVAEVVRAHGGTIEVESDDATGTRFTLRLPRR